METHSGVNGIYIVKRGAGTDNSPSITLAVAAFKAATDPQTNPFHACHLYRFVYGRSAICFAHGARPPRVGNLNSPTDRGGKYLMRQIIKIGKAADMALSSTGGSRLPIALRTHPTLAGHFSRPL